MGRKEYFDRLEELRLLKNSILNKSDNDPFFKSQAKQIVISDIEKQMNQLRLIAQQVA